MYCHTCGSPNQSAKAYCKSCGEWLPDLNAKTRHTFGGETPQQIVTTNLFMSAISTLAASFPDSHSISLTWVAVMRSGPFTLPALSVCA